MNTYFWKIARGSVTGAMLGASLGYVFNPEIVGLETVAERCKRLIAKKSLKVAEAMAAPLTNYACRVEGKCPEIKLTLADIFTPDELSFWYSSCRSPSRETSASAGTSFNSFTWMMTLALIGAIAGGVMAAFYMRNTNAQRMRP